MSAQVEQFTDKPAGKKVKKVIEISSSEDEEDTQSTTVETAKKRKVTFTAEVKVSSKKTKANSCAKKSTATAPGPRKPDRNQLLYILEGGGEEDASKILAMKSHAKVVAVNKTLSRSSGTENETTEGPSQHQGTTSPERDVVVKRVKSGGSTVIVDEDNSVSLDLREIEKIVGHSMKDSRMVVVFKNAPPVRSGAKNKDQVISNNTQSPNKVSTAQNLNGSHEDIFFPKRLYKDAFDKYFFEETAVCEHNDSLESESSEEEETYMFPLKNSSNKNNKTTNFKKTETKMSVVLNLMEEVTMDLPQWVAHSRPGSNKFWLARLELQDSSAPMTVSKFIEFDEEFNAKTFVDQRLVESLGGVYDSYEAIKKLLYSVDRYESVR